MKTILTDISTTYKLIQGGKIKKIIHCLFTPGVQAVVVFRFGQWLKMRNKFVQFPLTPIYFISNILIKIMWGIELPRSARIGKGFYIGHFSGIIISPHAIIGEYCSISQGVTIGASGSEEKYGAPTIGDHVYIAAGAKVFGKINIGNNVKIGANAVIYKDIPNNAVAVSSPGFKIISHYGNRPIENNAVTNHTYH
jgi:serine O-acetyltransferase